MDYAPGANVGEANRREFTRRYAIRQGELMRRLEAEPRVSGVTYSMVIPGDEPDARIEIQDVSASSHEVRDNRVDVDFFRTFEAPILAGRGFEPADVAREGGAVVVSQSLAQRVFGGDALGRRIRYAAPQNVDTGRWYEIVGIVSDFPPGVSPGMDGSPLRMYHAAAPGQVQPVLMAIRLRGGAPATFSGRLREIATAVDPDLHLRNILALP